MTKVAVFTLVAVLALGGCKTGEPSAPASNLDAVNPMIGGVGIILEPTRPTVHLPNSLIRSYPVKNDQLDDQIHYFPLTVASHRIASVFAFMPMSGPCDGAIWGKRTGFEREEATPYCYSARLEEPGDSIAFFACRKERVFSGELWRQARSLSAFGEYQPRRRYSGQGAAGDHRHRAVPRDAGLLLRGNGCGHLGGQISESRR